MTDVIRIPLTTVYLAWFLISFLMLWFSFWFIGTRWDTKTQEFRKENGKAYKHQTFVNGVIPIMFGCGLVGLMMSIGMLGVYAFLLEMTVNGYTIVFNYIFSGVPKIEFV